MSNSYVHRKQIDFCEKHLTFFAFDNNWNCDFEFTYLLVTICCFFFIDGQHHSQNATNQIEKQMKENVISFESTMAISKPKNDTK